MICPDENQLALLGEAALDDPTRAALESHIDRCAACDALVRELAGLATPGDVETETPTLPPRYRLLGRLGRGGMGVVWGAEDRELRRNVALKVVWGSRDDASLRARLLREARLIATVQHPHVVTVYDVGEHADQLYLAMELIDGATARAWRAGAPRSPSEILDVWVAAATGLCALHAAGIVHRDVKPENVLVANDGRVVVCDLGLAITEDGSSLTRSKHAVGTVAYMAPEQLYGEPVDARTDQFAWSLAVWEAITGRPALPAEPLVSPLATAHRHVLAVLARGFATSPSARWPDLGSLLAALAAARDRDAAPPRTLVRRLGRLFAGIVIVGGGLAFGVTRSSRETAPVAPIVAAARDATIEAPDASAPSVDVSILVDATVDAARAASRALTVDASMAPVVATVEAGVLPVVSTDAYDRYNELVAKVTLAETATTALDPRCRRLVAALPTPRADLGTSIADRVALVHPRCEMVAGDCTKGKQQLATYLRARGAPEEAVANELLDADTALCPIGASGTRKERERRVTWRLMTANASSLPCASIVDDAEAAQIKPAVFDVHAAMCLARAGQCDRAAGYLQSDAQRADLAQRFPTCHF